MPKLLALEWDEHEVRIAVANERGATAVLEKAFAVLLPPTVDNKPHDAAAVAAVIRESLAGESMRKVETLVVVGRPSIELKELSLPPAPDDELPDLVRFQALRDFTQLSDDTPLDFIPLRADGEEHRNVLAAAISNELLSDIRATCEQAGLELRHLVLRPCAAASLLARQQPAPGQVRMFVDLLGDEVDLTVLDQDSPLLMRTTRLPGDASHPEFTRPVFLEIRRTIASVQNKLHGRRVESIWLCGDGASQQSLADLVRGELELPTELFDPFTAFEQSAALRRRLPEHHSRFAPLLGMLADAAAGQRHGIDFLDPRRRPQPKTHRREAAIGVACLAGVLLLFAAFTWWRLTSLDNEIAGLGDKGRSLDAQLKQNSQVEKEAADLDKWLVADVPWLDILYRLSTEAPLPAEDAMLTSLVASAEKGKGGKLKLDVLAGDGDDMKKLQQKLVNADFKVSTGSIDPEKKSARYKVKFSADGQVTKQTIEAAKKAAQQKTSAKVAVAKQSDAKPSDANKTDVKVKSGEKPSADLKEAESPTTNQPAPSAPQSSPSPAATSPEKNVEKSAETKGS